MHRREKDVWVNKAVEALDDGIELAAVYRAQEHHINVQKQTLPPDMI